MSRDRANLVCYLCILAVVSVAAWLYPSLPDPMPSHWNAEGEVDGWMGRRAALAMLVGMPVLLFLLMRLVPRISPRGFGTASFSGVYYKVQVTIVAVVCFISIVVLLEARGYGVQLERLVPAAVGVLFIALGQFAPAFRKNFFLGIRTPWTLASDEVWARTHRLGGKLLIVIGVVFLAGAFFPLPPGWLIGFVLATALVPVVYSYFVYRQVEGFDDAD